jgi:hypothetical protein
VVTHVYTAIASLLVLGLYLWQDGVSDCNDGARYTSGKPQPPPFHRRFCGWNRRVLIGVSLASLFALGIAMGDWRRAVLLLALPGAHFVATHPTCTDAPCMLLAWCASLIFPTHPPVAVALSLCAGFMHERGPVFAAVYCWHPLPLLGLLASGWWRKPGGPDADRLVGHGTWAAIKAHKPFQDFLDPWTVVYGLRAVLPLDAYFGASPRAWAALALAFATRVIGTDSCRFLFWAAPPMIADTHDAPLWVIAAHVLTFRRAI